MINTAEFVKKINKNEPVEISFANNDTNLYIGKTILRFFERAKGEYAIKIESFTPSGKSSSVMYFTSGNYEKVSAFAKATDFENKVNEFVKGASQRLVSGEYA